MVIDIEKLAKGKQLWFAENGEKVRQAIIELIKSNRKERMVALDFKNIEVADTSFIREAFVKLINDLTLDVSRPQLIFMNVSEYMQDNLDTSLARHERFALATMDNSWVLVGKYSNQLRETLTKILERTECTAKQLAKELDINVTAANNRLSRLHDMCVVSRIEMSQETGGKEFLYRAEGDRFFWIVIHQNH